MMGSVKAICLCAAALAVAGHVAGMEPGKRAALLGSVGALVGGATAPGSARAPNPAAPASFRPPPVAISTPGGGLDAVDIPPDRFGQFQTFVEVEGQRIAVLIDTGASFVCLTYEDADRLGIRPMPSDFRVPVSTANGTVGVARTELREIRLGSVSARDVTAFVSPRGVLGRSLLGMSFLNQLRGFRVEAGHLRLQP